MGFSDLTLIGGDFSRIIVACIVNGFWKCLIEVHFRELGMSDWLPGRKARELTLNVGSWRRFIYFS